MRIVVVGYGEMFDALVAGVMESGHDLVGVFRQENIKYGFFRRLIHDLFMPSGNRLFSKSLGLYDIKAKSVNSDKFRREIKKLQADIILVGSWGEKFSAQTINTPKLACVNVHPSLLPKYRGPNPYTRVILNNEEETGVTFHVMDINYDTGSILHQVKTSVSKEETGLSLKLKCCYIAKREVPVLLKSFKYKLKNQISQNEQDSSYYPQISLADTILDFEKDTADDISRKIRALTPWINCYIPYREEFFEFKKYHVSDKYASMPPATIIKKTDTDLFIVCKDLKIIKFSQVKLKRPILRIFNKFYIRKFVEINSKAI